MGTLLHKIKHYTSAQYYLCVRILISVLLLVVSSIVRMNTFTQTLLLVIGWLVVYLDELVSAVREIVSLNVFCPRVLCCLPCVFSLAVGDAWQALTFAVIIRAGGIFTDRLNGKLAGNIGDVHTLLPEKVRCFFNGTETERPSSEIKRGDAFVVRTGDIVPIDAIVYNGTATVEKPRCFGKNSVGKAARADFVPAGSRINEGKLGLYALNSQRDCLVNRIAAYIDSAEEHRSEIETFSFSFSRIFAPVIAFFAVVLSIVPFFLFGGMTMMWVRRAIVLLFAASPALLQKYIPMMYRFSALRLANSGVVFKDNAVIEAFGNVRTVVFDRIGTLSTGKFTVIKLRSEILTSNELLTLIAHASYKASSPILHAISSCYKKPLKTNYIGSSEQLKGGVRTFIDGVEVCVGNRAMMQRMGVDLPEAKSGAEVFVTVRGSFAGSVTLTDELERASAGLMKSMRNSGVENIVVMSKEEFSISGDTLRVFHADELITSRDPQERLAKIDEMVESSDHHSLVAYVTSNKDEELLLSHADVGIYVMGGKSSYIPDLIDMLAFDMSELADAHSVSAKVNKAAVRYVVLVFVVKMLMLSLAVLGMLPLLSAALIEFCVSVIGSFSASNIAK